MRLFEWLVDAIKTRQKKQTESAIQPKLTGSNGANGNDGKPDDDDDGPPDISILNVTSVLQMNCFFLVAMFAFPL